MCCNWTINEQKVKKKVTTQNNNDNMDETSEEIRSDGGEGKSMICACVQNSITIKAWFATLTDEQRKWALGVCVRGKVRFGLIGVAFCEIGVRDRKKALLQQFSHCPTSLLHAGWLRRSWSCWNQPEKIRGKILLINILQYLLKTQTNAMKIVHLLTLTFVI